MDDATYRKLLIQQFTMYRNPMREATSILKALGIDFVIQETVLEFAVSRIDFATSVRLPDDVKDSLREAFENCRYVGFKNIYSFGYVKPPPQEHLLS